MHFGHDFREQVKIFKYNFLSLQWSKLGNLSAYWIENFLNFAKLTQLLSVGPFLRSLDASNKTGNVICPPLYLPTYYWPTTLPTYYWPTTTFKPLNRNRSTFTYLSTALLLTYYKLIQAWHSCTVGLNCIHVYFYLYHRIEPKCIQIIDKCSWDKIERYCSPNHWSFLF